MLAFILVGGIALSIVLWLEFHPEISQTVMLIMHWQIRFIQMFTDRFDEADLQLLAADPNNVTPLRLWRMMRAIGGFFLYPSIVLVLALATLCLTRAASVRHTARINLEWLIREQSKSFPGILAFVERRLRPSAIRKGEPRPADSALDVEEWIAAWAIKPGADHDALFDLTLAKRELVRQLGAPWSGVAKAAPHVRCMLAVFALHSCLRRGQAIELLGALSRSLPKSKKEKHEGPEQALCFSADVVVMADTILNQKDVAGTVQEIMSRHYFTATGLMSLLCHARQRAGLMPPGQFAFLKLVDRRLWYALHSLGFEFDDKTFYAHPSPRVEAIGARDHWAAEKAVKTRLPVPVIEQALEAILRARADKTGGATLFEDV